MLFARAAAYRGATLMLMSAIASGMVQALIIPLDRTSYGYICCIWTSHTLLSLGASADSHFPLLYAGSTLSTKTKDKFLPVGM